MQLEHHVFPSWSNFASRSSRFPQPGSPTLLLTPLPPHTRQVECQRVPRGPAMTPGSITATIFSHPAHRYLLGKEKLPALEVDASLRDDTGRGAVWAWTGGSAFRNGITETGRCRVTIVDLGGSAHSRENQ